MLHFIVFIWGFTAILGLLISVPAIEVVFFRTSIAAIVLIPVLKAKKITYKIGSDKVLKIFLTGFIIAFHWILFFGAARVSNASVALIGMATTSIWTSLLEPMVNRKRIKIFEVILGIAALIGITIIFASGFNYPLGLVMALGSAFLAAVFTIINAKFTLKYDPYLITFYEMSGASLIILIILPVSAIFFGGAYFLPQPVDWIYLILLAVICTVYAFSVSVELMKRVSAFAVNLTVNLEPVYGIILALIVFGDSEKMQENFYIGGLMILLSVINYPLLNRYFKRKALNTDIWR